MKKLLILLFALCLLLSACTGGGGLGAPTTTSPQPETPQLTAEFLPLDEGLEALKIFYWGSEGWHFYAGGEYLFAAFGGYLVRYSIAENKVDRVVAFDYPESWWCGTSVSPDGEMGVVKAIEIFRSPDETNKILIDFKQKTVAPAPEDFQFPKKENDLNFLYRIEERSDEDENRFYKLSALDGSVTDKEIHAILVSLGEATLIDENRMGVIMASGEETSGYLGYDKFVVIDISQDKIIQECVLNEWDGYGRDYWEARFAQENED